MYLFKLYCLFIYFFGSSFSLLFLVAINLTQNSARGCGLGVGSGLAGGGGVLLILPQKLVFNNAKRQNLIY